MIHGTQQFHCFIPSTCHTEIIAKVYSLSDKYCKHSIGGSKTLAIDEMVGFVTCEYDQRWWLACVLSQDFDNEEVTVTILEPPGPAPSFVYPSKEDILTVARNKVLTRVQPRTATGRTYTLAQKEMSDATKMLERRLATK